MTRQPAYRGQPVLMLLALLAGWAAVRIVLWQSPFPEQFVAGAEAAARVVAPIVHHEPEPAVEPPRAIPSEPAPFAPVPYEPPATLPASAPPEPPLGWALAAEPPRALPPRVSGGHVLLLAAAVSAFEVPPELVALVLRARANPAAIPPFPVIAEYPKPASRWSGDGWLLLRRDTSSPITSGRGSYGRSQFGTVLRYRLVPTSGHRPTAYVRASQSLTGPREAEVALGLSARPLPGVPVTVAAEMRAARFDERFEARPAAFAYTEFPPLKLPLGARGEAYLQAGYVGGEFATAFVDGQARIDRPVARLGPAELRAGAGAWGGAQKDARRLDVGPGVTVAVELGGAPVRMSADWRFRVAGDAEPASGPALTISAGF